MSENFTFHGDTTFINKPTHVIVRDFQNTYLPDGGVSLPALRRIAELVELVASSTALGDADRREIVTALDTMAAEVKNGTADQPAVKGRLRSLADTLRGAADIATPALTIIAALADLIKLG